jgi:ribosomal subunit interface protein
MMEVRVQSVKFDADSKLVAYVTKKVSKLDRFFDNIIAAEVTMSLTSDYDNKKVAIRLEIPGYDLHAERQSATFEKAVLQCVDVLKIQLKKTKEKMRGE